MVHDPHLSALKETIRQLCGRESRWIETVPVREVAKDGLGWTGDVEVFELVGHATASVAYAWMLPGAGAVPQFTAVLGGGLVDTPARAVQAAAAALAGTRSRST